MADLAPVSERFCSPALQVSSAERVTTRWETIRPASSPCGHLDKFAWIGAFSGTGNGLSTAPIDPKTFIGGIFADGGGFNAKVRMLWVGMGTEEPDPFPGATGAFRKMLDQAGVKYVYFESPGTSHEWLTWRRDLNDFAPRLFR